MQVLACLNGEIMPVEQAKVPVWDRGFLFGDSVYEVFRMYQGRCWLEAEHLARLKRSLEGAGFRPARPGPADGAGCTRRSGPAGSTKGRSTSRSPAAWRPGRIRSPILRFRPPS